MLEIEGGDVRYSNPALRRAVTGIGVSAVSGAKAHIVYRVVGLWLTMALAAGACGGTETTTLLEVEPVQPSLVNTADGVPDVEGILEEAQASIDAGRYEEAIEMCATVVTLVEGTDDPELEGVPGKEAIARALSKKAVALLQLDRHEEVLVVLEEVDARFRNATDKDLMSRVAWALNMKGLVLGDNGSYEEAVAAFEEALARLGDMNHAEFGYHIASALYWKGVYLRSVGWRVLDAAAAFDEVITRFGDSTEPEVLDLVELATQDNDEIADLVEQLVAGRDGVWAGTTSDGESFSVTLESGDITAVSFGFDCACSELSPVSAQSGDRPLGRMGGAGATFAADLTGLVQARIEGSFTADGTAQGTIALEIGPDCGGPREVAWQATLPTASDVPPAEDAWWGKQPPPDLLPTVAIDPELYDPVVGVDGHDQYGAVFDTNGDWYLIGSLMNVFIAVPAGWETVEIGSETYLMYGESQDGDWPPIRVRLGSDGYEGDTRTSSDVLADVAGMVAEDGGIVHCSEVVDDTRGWALVSMATDKDRTRTMLLAYSKNPQEGWFHTFSGFAYEDVLDDYYPILRAMIGSWYGLYDNPLGFPLPRQGKGAAWSSC